MARRRALRTAVSLRLRSARDDLRFRDSPKQRPPRADDDTRGKESWTKNQRRWLRLVWLRPGRDGGRAGLPWVGGLPSGAACAGGLSRPHRSRGLAGAAGGPETLDSHREFLCRLERLPQQALQGEPVVTTQLQFRAIGQHDREFPLRQWQQFPHAADVDQRGAMYAHKT
jgi:hypothetical protein